MDTPYPEDVRHWVRVYQELLNFKATIVEQMLSSLQEMAPEARELVIGTDLLQLQIEARQLAARLEYWQRRDLELRSGVGPGEESQPGPGI